jgi:hypothetical protein
MTFGLVAANDIAARAGKQAESREPIQSDGLIATGAHDSRVNPACFMREHCAEPG